MPKVPKVPKGPRFRLERIEIVIQDYLDDVTIIVPDPQTPNPPKGIPVTSNITYQQVFVSVLP